MDVDELFARFVTRWPLAASQGGARCYGKRSGQLLVGEIPFMHVLFEPVTDEPVTELQVTSDQASDSSVVLMLPFEYGEMLCVTNGAMLFGGHLVLYGLLDTPEAQAGVPMPYRPSLIAVANATARHPALRDEYVHLGTYYASQQMLVFDVEKDVIAVTEPGGMGVAKTWGYFGEYLAEEFRRLETLFAEATRSKIRQPYT